MAFSAKARRIFRFHDGSRMRGMDPLEIRSKNACRIGTPTIAGPKHAHAGYIETVKALIAAGKRVSYAEIESVHGHDAFLMTDEPYMNLMRAYLQRVAVEVAA